TYHQNDPKFHEFGLGTTMAYAMFIENPNLGSTVELLNLVLADGTRIPFKLKSGSTVNLDPDNLYVNTSPSQFGGATLTVDANLQPFYLTLRGGTKMTFGTHHSYNQLQSISDGNGNTVTLNIPNSHLIDKGNSYSGSVQRITSPNGRYINLVYDYGKDQKC